jgi:proline iminopeptidase
MSLYPTITPYNTGKLVVSGDHVIYFEEYGSPDGMPVLFSHGGPGGAIPRHYARLFDPKAFRMIFWDQRGSGLSEPTGSLINNTTWDLLGDIEQLREHLKIERWLVSGYSWGSTLSLIYAINHPKRVLALLIGAVFLGTQAELDWLFKGGAGKRLPESWNKFVNHIPPEERGDLIAAYDRRIKSPYPAVRNAAIYHWGYWFGSISPARFSATKAHSNASSRHVALMAPIAHHYFDNRLFIPDGYILDHISQIEHIPCAIVHGRLDLNTPLSTAQKLHAAWPNSKFTIVASWGHWGLDDSLYDVHISETIRLHQLLTKKEG